MFCSRSNANRQGATDPNCIGQYGVEMSIKHEKRGVQPMVHSPSRRDVLVIGAGALAASSMTVRAAAQASGDAEHYGLSAFGDLQYPANFA